MNSFVNAIFLFGLVSLWGCTTPSRLPVEEHLSLPPDLPMCEGKPCPKFQATEKQRVRTKAPTPPRITQPETVRVPTKNHPHVMDSAVIKFRNNKTKLSQSLQKALSTLLHNVDRQSLTAIELRGGTSSTAQERLLAVQRYLVEVLQIPNDRIVISDFPRDKQTPVEVTVYDIQNTR